MADIELVIKIDKNTYNRITSGFANEDDAVLFENLLKNGTLLPKGHGDLVDIDEIWHLYDYSDIDYTMIDAVENASTIIEADTKESEDKE